MMKTVCSHCQVATSTVTLRFVAPRLKDRTSAGKVPRAPEHSSRWTWVDITNPWNQNLQAD